MTSHANDGQLPPSPDQHTQAAGAAGATETPGVAGSVQAPAAVSGNRPARMEWFRDLALGMFVHWSVDVQLGSVISHSLVGASLDYRERFFHVLPATFFPKRFDPEEWARLARLAGMKYVVFTTKHHSGFCMFDTQTTAFSVMHTPYGQDIVRQVVDAFRRHGIAIGFYFSPDDFWVLHQQGHEISRQRPEANPLNNPQLMAHNQAQVQELLTRYGPIDIIFFDGVAEGLKQLAWELQPDIVVTRGDMGTPEQEIPDQPLPGPWEACFTMGTQWHYKPTNEVYKSGTRLIEMLIETRAKGGNLLLNVGPMPDGEIPIEQTARIRELALWMFVNQEAMSHVRPWHVTREDKTWYTCAPNQGTVYAILTQTPLVKGQQVALALRQVRATAQTEIELLGQSGQVLEYAPEVNPKTRWAQDEGGLHITAMRAQRLYNDSRWPNPIVLKITHAIAPE